MNLAFRTFPSYRIVMALDLELWYIRSIVFMGVSSQLGPKIVMIRKMVRLLPYLYSQGFIALSF